jgi:NADPH:quinone reductase-like Zn-dependent oxidoreductase
MKASVSKMYGTPEVFKMIDIVKPIPKHNEVLVRIYAENRMLEGYIWA